LHVVLAALAATLLMLWLARGERIAPFTYRASRAVCNSRCCGERRVLRVSAATCGRCNARSESRVRRPEFAPTRSAPAAGPTLERVSTIWGPLRQEDVPGDDPDVAPRLGS
jgi:hypothetical protein